MIKIMTIIISLFLIPTSALAWDIADSAGDLHLINHQQPVSTFQTIGQNGRTLSGGEGQLTISIICSPPSSGTSLGTVKLMMIVPSDNDFSKIASRSSEIVMFVSGDGVTNSHVMKFVNISESGMLLEFKSVFDLVGRSQDYSIPMMGFFLELLKNSSDHMDFLLLTYDNIYDPGSSSPETASLLMTVSATGSTRAANHIESKCGKILAPLSIN